MTDLFLIYDQEMRDENQPLQLLLSFNENDVAMNEPDTLLPCEGHIHPGQDRSKVIKRRFRPPERVRRSEREKIHPLAD